MRIISLVLAVILAIGLSILLIFGLLFAFIGRGLKKFQLQKEKEAKDRYPNAILINANANFLGLQSEGAFKVRGNGTLIITDEFILFEMWFPAKAISIPFSTTYSIDQVMSHLGKTYFRPLIKISFKNQAGQNDSAAWYVPNVEKIKKLIESKINNQIIDLKPDDFIRKEENESN